MSTKRARILELADLATAGRLPTMAEIFPSLLNKVRPELLEQPTSRFFRLELLRDAPATWVRMGGLSLEEISDSEGAALADALQGLNAQLELASRVAVLVEPGALTLTAAAVAARTGVDGERATRSVSAFLAIPPEQLLPAGTLNPVIFDKEAVFEARALAWARTIHLVAEGAYLPLLKTAVDLTNIAAGHRPERWPRKAQLGNVMRTAQLRWSAEPSLRTLLHDDVRRVRNAVAHVSVGVELEPDKLRLRESGEELSEGELSEIGRKLLMAIVAMRAAFQLSASDGFVRSVVAEGFAKAIGEHIVKPASDSLRGAENTAREET